MESIGAFIGLFQASICRETARMRIKSSCSPLRCVAQAFCHAYLFIWTRNGKSNWSYLTVAIAWQQILGSTLIESARGKKYGGLDLSLLPRADRGTWNACQIAVSRLQSITPKCIREQVMEGAWAAEGGREVTWWRGVNIAPKNNNRASSSTSGDSWFIFRCKWAPFFQCSWKVPPFFWSTLTTIIKPSTAGVGSALLPSAAPRYLRNFNVGLEIERISNEGNRDRLREQCMQRARGEGKTTMHYEL